MHRALHHAHTHNSAHIRIRDMKGAAAWSIWRICIYLACLHNLEGLTKSPLLKKTGSYVFKRDEIIRS